MYALFLLFAMPIYIAWEAFVATKLWAWFFVPQFGVPVISLGMAAGMILLLHFVFSHPRHEVESRREKDPRDECLNSLLWMIFKPAIALGFGWLVLLAV